MLATTLLLASTLTWSPTLDDALLRAKSEKKLVLVYLRSPAEKANREADANVAGAVANENVAFMLESFVLARMNGRLPGVDLAGPRFVVLDPDGRFVRAARVGSLKELAMALSTLRERAPEIVRARDVRAAGHPDEADIILGREIVSLGEGQRGAEILEEAAKKLRRQGDIGTALYAELWAGVAHYTYQPLIGRRMVEKIASGAGPPRVIAEAWLFLGDMAVQERRKLFAVEAYRKAYDLAPAGSAVLRRARRELETHDSRPLPPKGEERTATLRLISPARRTVTGRAQFIVEADPGIARVELFLDDVPVASSDRRPFHVTVDVGAVAVMRGLKAVGYDDSGARVGEAVVTINDRQDAFHVAITAPAETFVRGRSDIEAAVEIPPSRKLDRIELYWKETAIARLTAPPFRHPFEFPAEFGYVRAVAVLDDGTRIEDARIFNAEGASESVDVRAVTMLATVTDAAGKRVEGLTEQDFVIEDEGTPVAATVRQATDTPVTIGVAIDSSGSMRNWMFEALETATNFIRSGEGSDDRTFVVAFDMAPRLVHAASADIESLRARILEITASGGTSIFDGAIFALQQFQDTPGRKALVMISDGREGLSTQSAAAAIRTARAAAIPIYGLGPQGIFGPALQTLAEATGGVAFPMPRKSELPAVFARIRDDVRGQYLISFAPQRVKPGTWRDVKVRLRRPDLKVRTVSGYYAR